MRIYYEKKEYDQLTIYALFCAEVEEEVHDLKTDIWLVYCKRSAACFQKEGSIAESILILALLAITW